MQEDSEGLKRLDDDVFSKGNQRKKNSLRFSQVTWRKKETRLPRPNVREFRCPRSPFSQKRGGMALPPADRGRQSIMKQAVG